MTQYKTVTCAAVPPPSPSIAVTILCIPVICTYAPRCHSPHTCSELFTNCLDMLCTLLYSLPSDFHICMATGGEEGKKTYTGCIKKLKAEMSSAKSACLSEIQHLFPLPQRSYEVVTVKPPSFTQSKGLSMPSGERIKVRLL